MPFVIARLWWDRLGAWEAAEISAVELVALVCVLVRSLGRSRYLCAEQIPSAVQLRVLSWCLLVYSISVAVWYLVRDKR